MQLHGKRLMNLVGGRTRKSRMEKLRTNFNCPNTSKLEPFSPRHLIVLTHIMSNNQGVNPTNTAKDFEFFLVIVLSIMYMYNP